MKCNKNNFNKELVLRVSVICYFHEILDMKEMLNCVILYKEKIRFEETVTYEEVYH
jgi:hypothetical protein